MRTWVPLGRRAACRASSGPETPAVQNVPSRSRAEQPPTPQASAALGSADMGRLGSSHVRGVANTGQPARAPGGPRLARRLPWVLCVRRAPRSLLSSVHGEARHRF